ncbi:phosphate ABC transporter permease subunit PstC [Streptacidiphilus sp. MAP12-16]|uniref:phosphate ABC transporter permease subunit PstC n=1 Tax=Streptacidiphilus sp. MAP12-16 TaxID=3156300 RepID=UPI00351247BA
MPENPSPPDTDTRRVLSANPGLGDRLFQGGARGSGALVLAVMLAVGTFLAYQAAQALKVGGFAFLTTQTWEPDAGHGHFGIAAVLCGTVLIGLLAVSLALPMALAAALYISEYAPRQLKQTLISLVDLMAAVPSVVYGLWGFFFLEQRMTGLARWISTYFGWIPLFKVDGADPNDPLAPVAAYTSSTFIAGTVVAFMITPIMCSVMREVFGQAPPGEREGAYALGATRWGVIRSVVLPYGRGGVIGGTMLGLGRALGETITVYMIISMVFAIQPHLLQSGASTVSALIALHYGDSSSFGISALMAAGFALFLMTLAVNFAASAVVARSRSGAST